MDIQNIDQPLFIEGLSFEKEASTELPLDESQWILGITQEIHEQLPALEGQQYEIEMKKTDSEKGVGYGSIVGKGYVIPLIVDDNKLMSMDVYIDADGKSWPTGFGYLESYISQSSVNNYGITKDKRRHSTLDLFQRMNPPDSYHGNFRSSGGGSRVQESPVFASDKSMLAKLMKTDAEVEKLASDLKSNPQIVASFHRNKMDEVLKIALVKSAHCEEAKCCDGTSKTEAFVIEPNQTPDVVKTDGCYIVRTTGGKYRKCNIFCNVIGFDLEPRDYKIAGKFENVNDHTKDVYAIQPEIAGIRIGDTRGSKHNILGYGSGDFGSFVLEKDGDTVLIEPVKIISSVCYEKEDKTTIRKGYRGNSIGSDMNNAEVTQKYEIEEYLVQDMMGQQFKVMKGPKFKGISEVDGTYYLSDESRFIEFPEEKVELTVNPTSFEMAVEARKEIAPITIKLAGAIVSSDAKWASDELRSGTFVKRAKEELCKYYTEESISEVLKKASKGGVIKINPPKLEKKASAPVAAPPRFDILKIAAAINDPETVDKILSLNFLNSANVSRFVEFQSDIKTALSKVADLLLASRIGLQIPSVPLKSAMSSLAETLMYLDSVEKEQPK